MAYSGLADALNMLDVYDEFRSKVFFQRARDAALKAVEIDPGLAEAHASLGWVLLEEWKWKEAEQAFRQSLQLKPGFVMARFWYSHLLTVFGRLDEALVQVRHARQLDPLSSLMNFAVGRVHYYRGEYEEAIRYCRLALEKDPANPKIRLQMSLILAEQGKYGEAISDAQARDSTMATPEQKSISAIVLATAGKYTEARQVLKVLLENSANGRVSAERIAVVYSVLGNPEKAFSFLEQAYEARDSEMIWLNVQPEFRSLRRDPRFQSLLRRMGLDS